MLECFLDQVRRRLQPSAVACMEVLCCSGVGDPLQLIPNRFEMFRNPGGPRHFAKQLEQPLQQVGVCRTVSSRWPDRELEQLIES